MKMIRPTTRAKEYFAAFFWSLALVSAAFAQTGSPVPVVTIQATQRIATMTHPGVFTVFRAGNTDATLNVWYDLGGMASNGVDYAAISPHLVEIAAGEISNDIVIAPLTNLPPSSAAKTVVLTLTNSPMMTPVNYEIGSPSSATVYIANAGITNLPPQASIITPTNGETFFVPTNGAPIISSIITLGATASDPDGYVTNVEFFANGTDLGSGLPLATDPPSPIGIVYYLAWSDPPAGNYALTAVATDNGGLSATSAPVKISVVNSPPPTNVPPAVRIDSPTNGATFFGGLVCPPCVTNNPPCDLPCYFEGPDIPIYATASASSGTASIEFFADGQDLGPGALEGCLTPAGNCVGCPPPVLTCTYSLVWSNAPIGIHVLTAVATDNGGLSTTSAPVKITVQLPPTNFPPVVRITSPPNGSVFRAPVKIPIYAYAADRDDSISSVEFFADGASLGLGHHVVTAVPSPFPIGQPYPPPPILIVVTNFWELTWTNPPPGTKIALTAEATDNGGLSTTSNPVLVSILPPLPPPTNRPAIVRIIATDPVAIEGTNCWTWPGLAGPAATWSNWFAANATFGLHTNCGPKDATISLFRFGDTNNDLDVAYTIGGTATNGIDYVALPGVVTIPAGERRADITIVPLDDGPPDITSTVVLKPVPDVTGTNYLLGFPRAAAAVILDSHSPRAVTGIVPGPAFNLAAAGPDGAWFHVEYSTDLIHWTPICTNQVVNGSMDFVDPDAASNPVRFYRTVPEAGPPQ